MEVFRLAVKEYATLDGIGGLYCSGRWHHEGKHVVYTASSRSLSVLERFIHESSMVVPSLVMLSIYIPDDLPQFSHAESTLPKGWDAVDDEQQSATQDLGDKFLSDNKYAYMKVPSAIVPHEYNYIINPRHPDSSRIKINETLPYHYDERYKRFIKK